MFKRRLLKLGLYDPDTQPLSPRIPNDRWMKKWFAGPLVVTSEPVTLNHQAMLWSVHGMQPCFQCNGYSKSRRGETKTCSACHAAMNPGQKPEQWPPTADRGEERKNLQNLKAQVPMSSTTRCFNIHQEETSGNCKQYQVNQSTRHAKTKPIGEILTRPWPLWFARIAAHQLHAKPSMQTNCPMGIYLDHPSEESAETTHCDHVMFHDSTDFLYYFWGLESATFCEGPFWAVDYLSWYWIRNRSPWWVCASSASCHILAICAPHDFFATYSSLLIQWWT